MWHMCSGCTWRAQHSPNQTHAPATSNRTCLMRCEPTRGPPAEWGSSVATPPQARSLTTCTESLPSTRSLALARKQASKRPEGVMKKGKWHQWRWRRECRPSLSVISAAFMALGKSCLLANTSSTASRSSSCTARPDAMSERTSTRSLMLLVQAASVRQQCRQMASVAALALMLLKMSHQLRICG